MGLEDPAAPFPLFARDELARFFDSTHDGRDSATTGSPEGS